MYIGSFFGRSFYQINESFTTNNPEYSAISKVFKKKVNDVFGCGIFIEYEKKKLITDGLSAFAAFQLEANLGDSGYLMRGVHDFVGSLNAISFNAGLRFRIRSFYE
ncbi:MAG: hypothetical protein ACERKD_01160 [Prolixibacteraceae bacterium]